MKHCYVLHFFNSNLGFLVDPIKLRTFVVNHLTLTEPKSYLILCSLNAVGPVADIAANVL